MKKSKIYCLIEFFSHNYFYTFFFNSVSTEGLSLDKHLLNNSLFTFLADYYLPTGNTFCIKILNVVGDDHLFFSLSSKLTLFIESTKIKPNLLLFDLLEKQCISMSPYIIIHANRRCNIFTERLTINNH